MSAPFIVLDGPDGSGTTYHGSALSEALRSLGHDVLLTAEPTDGPVAQRIRGYLHENAKDSIEPDDLQKLFIADRAEHVATVIEPALRRGAVVVCDRYVLSTIAYGSATGGDVDALKQMNEGFPKPDLTILLLPSLEVCMERIARRSGKDMFETRDLQQKVHAAYRQLAFEDPSIVVVDTSGLKEQTAAEVLHIVRERLR